MEGLGVPFANSWDAISNPVKTEDSFRYKLA